MAKGKASKATPSSKAKVQPKKARKTGTVRAEAAFDALDLPPVEGSEAARNKYLPAAQALPKESIEPFNVDASLAYYNVALGLDAVLERRTEVERELPRVKLSRLRELVQIALAVAFAAAQVDDKAGSPRTIAKLRTRAAELRNVMLASAVSLKVAGVVPAREVERIEEGVGARDQAQDCVDLAALFRKHAAKVRGKTTVTAAQIAEAAKVGTELLSRLKPRGARRKPKAASEAARERDQLGALLRQRHVELEKVGGYLWGYDAATHVPPLGSRVFGKRTKKTPPARPAGATAAATA
jgi:hypothetical protein